MTHRIESVSSSEFVPRSARSDFPRFLVLKFRRQIPAGIRDRQQPPADARDDGRDDADGEHEPGEEADAPGGEEDPVQPGVGREVDGRSCVRFRASV